VPRLLDVLVHAELVRRERDGLRLSEAGRRAVARDRAENGRPLALALIRSGLLHDQARALLDTFPTTSGGGVACRAHDARSAAPQLLGLLERWPIRSGHAVEIPAELISELLAVWALIAPPSEERAIEETRRKSIGDRAEAYSYQLERLAAPDSSHIVWVARDDSNLGYDIEDRSSSPRRRIEVKGSGGSDPRFFMSDNEWRKAHEDPSSYEVQFWGGIDLNRPVAEEYSSLRERGYPIVLRDLPALAALGQIAATTERWRVAARQTAEERR
jgi:hypothetical protein